MNIKNTKTEELFKEYIRLQPNSEELYYPDCFIKEIHTEYLKNGVVRLPNPLYATWDIVSACNLNCVFCSACASRTENSFIDNEKTMYIAEKILESQIKYLSIRGGEPTLYRQLPLVVKKCIETGIFVEIVSNGLHIDETLLNVLRLLPSSLYKIKISIDSYCKDTNDLQRGKNSFDNAIRAMEKCQGMKIPYRNQMVVTKNNYRDICETYKLCSELGAESFGCMLLLPIGRGRSSKLKIQLNETILEQLIYILKNEKKTKLEKIGLGTSSIEWYKDMFDSSIGSEEDAVILGHLKCNGAKTRIYINENGDVYPCDLLQYSDYYMGNIISDNNYWNSENAISFCGLNRRNRQRCRSCSFYQCNMGCYAISIENKDSEGRMRPNCEV